MCVPIVTFYLARPEGTCHTKKGCVSCVNVMTRALARHEALWNELLAMKTTLDFWNLMHLLGAAQGIFMAAVFFFHQRGNRVANRFLGMLLLVFSLRLLEIVAFWTRYFLIIPDFFLITFPLTYLFGVLFYLYTQQLLPGKRKTHKHTWVHFVPFILCLLYMIPFYSLSNTTKLFILENYVYAESGGTADVPILRLVISVLQFPHVLIYLVLSIRLLMLSTVETKNSGRFPDRARLIWLYRLTAGFGLFFALWFIYGLAVAFGLSYQRRIDYMVTFFMTFFIYTTGYSAFRIPEVFSEGSIAGNGPKYEKSILTVEQAHRCLNTLKRVMEMEKPYRQSNLKLPDLAKRLNISTNMLSQIINEYLNQNFFDLINQYRVEEAKQMLSDPKHQHYTLLRIAFDVGFNNKTSFNNFFKKITGMTPSEFRRKTKGNMR